SGASITARLPREFDPPAHLKRNRAPDPKPGLEDWRAQCGRPLPVLRLEEPLRVDRGHAARAGGGHRLAVARVLDVAAGEDAGDVGLRRPWPGHDVAALVHLELAREELRVGLVADGDEEALGLERAALVGARVLDHHARDPAVLRIAQDLAHG